MKIGIFGDQRFLYDNNGNYYTKGNLRGVLLNEYSKHFEKIYMFFRTNPSDLSWAPKQDLIQNDKIEFIHLPTFEGLFGLRKNKRQISEIIEKNIDKCDICILRFCYKISCIAAEIARNKNIPTIAHLRGDVYQSLMFDERIPFKALRWLIATREKQKNYHAVNLCDRVIGTSKAVAQLYTETGRWAEGIADGCTTEDFFMSVNPRNNDEPANLILVARINYAKNIQQVIEACAKLKRQKMLFKLHILGDGPYLTKLKKLAGDIDVSDLVEFHGRIDSRKRLIEYYRKSHIGILTSRAEGLPSSILESMSASLPVVCTNIPCMHEIVEEGRNGYLVEIGDVESCAKCLSNLISNESLRQQMGKASQQKAAEYRMDKQVEKLARLCESLLVCSPQERWK